MVEILEAVEDGDNKKFQLLLEANSENAFLCDDNGRTLLSWVLEQGSLDMLNSILQKGVDINSIFDGCDETPLHNAITAENVETAIYMIERGFHINYKDESGRSPLYVLANLKAAALWSDNLEIILNKLIEHGAILDSVPIAAAFGTVQNVNDLINSGNDLDEFLEFSYGNAIQLATINNDKEMVNYLVKMNANINWTNYNQLNAVDLATNKEIESILRAHGGQTNREIMEEIDQGQNDIRAIQNLIVSINTNK